MKFSWKNIENWRSWKMRFFWGGHFEFSKSAILNFFLLHLCEKSSPFIWGIIIFCTMDGFSRILEKKLSELLCTRLYVSKKREYIATLQSLIEVFNCIKVCRNNFSCLVTLTLHNLVFYDIFSDEAERLAKVCKSNWVFWFLVPYQK